MGITILKVPDVNNTGVTPDGHKCLTSSNPISAVAVHLKDDDIILEALAAAANNFQGRVTPLVMGLSW